MGGYFPWAPCVYRPCDHIPPAGAVGAGRALVGLLPGVGPLVRGQVVRAAEHLVVLRHYYPGIMWSPPAYLATHPTGVGLDAGVEPHVPGQHVTPSEAPLTNVAKVSLGQIRTIRVNRL